MTEQARKKSLRLRSSLLPPERATSSPPPSPTLIPPTTINNSLIFTQNKMLEQSDLFINSSVYDA